MARPKHRGDGMHATHEVAADLGVGYRRLHRLVQAGHVTPTIRPTGSGSSTRWSDADIAEARRIIARIDWGMTPAAAARSTDPPLPGAEKGPWLCHVALNSEDYRAQGCQPPRLPSNPSGHELCGWCPPASKAGA